MDPDYRGRSRRGETFTRGRKRAQGSPSPDDPRPSSGIFGRLRRRLLSLPTRARELDPMITAIVQYRLPPSISLEACAEHFRKIAPGFRTVPGLIRKQF